jgi:hypothetical protein
MYHSPRLLQIELASKIGGCRNFQAEMMIQKRQTIFDVVGVGYLQRVGEMWSLDSRNHVELKFPPFLFDFLQSCYLASQEHLAWLAEGSHFPLHSHARLEALLVSGEGAVA